MTEPPSSYAAAGVDVAAGEEAVAAMRSWVAAAQRPEAIGEFGGFSGLFDISALKEYRRPLLCAATDGVGTKIEIARVLGKHDTIGRDLVAMVVDDLVVSGAEPLYLTDYIACGKVDPTRIATIVSGIAAGCIDAGCALIGGETAEHPGVMPPDAYDLAAAGTAVVEADEMLGSHRVAAGDVLVGLASSGLHSNGYSLARAVLLGDDPAAALARHVDEVGRTVGEELLEPTRIYARSCLELVRTPGVEVHAMAHVTGGGLAANLARVIPPELTAVVDRGTWHPQPVFDVIAATGGVAMPEMEVAFNMGVGMVLVVPAQSLAAVFARATEAQLAPWLMGQVRQFAEGDFASAPPKGGSGGTVMLTGRYAT